MSKFIKEEVSCNNSDFRISTRKSHIGKIQIFPLPGYSLKKVTKDNKNERLILDFNNERWNASGNCKISFEGSSFVVNEYVPQYPSKEEEEDEEEEYDYDPFKEIEKDYVKTETNRRGIHQYEFENFVIEKTGNGISIISLADELEDKKNKATENEEEEEEELVIARLWEIPRDFSLQDGDCINYVHYFKGHGLVLIQNCGDVCSCVLVYVPELDEWVGLAGQ